VRDSGRWVQDAGGIRRIVRHTPPIFASYALTTRKLRSARLLKLAKLTLLSSFHSAHAALSGFSKQEQDMLHHGQCPEHFSAAQKIAYKVAVELGKPGAMSSELWDQAMNVSSIQHGKGLVQFPFFISRRRLTGLITDLWQERNDGTYPLCRILLLCVDHFEWL
jgi:hypothetical protein